MTGDGAVRVDVDADTCVGSTWCTTVAARTFVMGPDGKAHVANLDGVDIEELQEAEDSCPVSAIRVTGPPTDQGA